jgi:hypothetical protein
MERLRSGSQPPTPFDHIYRSNQKSKMLLQAEKKIIANKGYFGLTSTAPHLTPSNQPSSATLPRDLHDDATCTTHHRSFTSFEAKLENPSHTHFQTKQVARSQCVPRCLHPPIGVVAQPTNHIPLGFKTQTKKPW